MRTARDKTDEVSPVPSVPEIDFPAYGLPPRCALSRSLGQWERMQPSLAPGPALPPIFHVQLIHTLDEAGTDALFRPDILVIVHTIAKQPEGRTHPAPLRAAASAALFGMAQIAVASYVGVDRDAYLLERDAEANRLESDLDSGDWSADSVTVKGDERSARLHRVNHAWAVVIDVDDMVAIGASGYGVDPGEFELVPIDDLEAYSVRYP